jgi:hypothetical protein
MAKFFNDKDNNLLIVEQLTEALNGYAEFRITKNNNQIILETKKNYLQQVCDNYDQYLSHPK